MIIVRGKGIAMMMMFTMAMSGLVGCTPKARKGGAIGAAGGAVAGAIIGKVTGSTVRGAIIGAAVGGAAGAIIGAQMDKQSKEIEKDIPGATVTRVGEGIVVTFPSGLLFAFNSDQVEGAAGENLTTLAQSLNKYPKSNVLIVGHTDAVGTNEYNQGLSERRASAGATYLVQQGVDRSRVSTRGMGEGDPIASNDTDAGRTQNRRVEVAIYANEEAREAAKKQAGE